MNKSKRIILGRFASLCLAVGVSAIVFLPLARKMKSNDLPKWGIGTEVICDIDHKWKHDGDSPGVTSIFRQYLSGSISYELGNFITLSGREELWCEQFYPEDANIYEDEPDVRCHYNTGQFLATHKSMCRRVNVPEDIIKAYYLENEIVFTGDYPWSY